MAAPLYVTLTIECTVSLDEKEVNVGSVFATERKGKYVAAASADMARIFRTARKA
jgi:hypothetical protein